MTIKIPTIPDFSESQSTPGDDPAEWVLEAVQGQNVSVAPFTQDDVEACLGECSDYSPYDFSESAYLLLLKDGRLALVHYYDSGTCSYCGSGYRSVKFALDFRKMYEFGLTDAMRAAMKLEKVAARFGY